MKNNRKIIYIVLAIIAVIVIGIIFFNSNKKEDDTTNSYEEDKSNIDVKGTDNVEIKEDKIINTSNDLTKAKTIKGLKIEGITVTYVGGQTEIRGTIKNETSTDISADFVKLNIIDSNNKVFRTIEVYIGKVNKNSQKLLNVTTQADLSNMKDMSFE